MTPEDLPRMETRYAVVRLEPRTAAVIYLSTSSKTGDGPYIGNFQLIKRLTAHSWENPIVPALALARELAAIERES